MIPAVRASNFLRFGLALIIQFLGDLLLVALPVQSGQAAEDLQPGRLGDGGLNSSRSTSWAAQPLSAARQNITG